MTQGTFPAALLRGSLLIDYSIKVLFIKINKYN